MEPLDGDAVEERHAEDVVQRLGEPAGVEAAKQVGVWKASRAGRCYRQRVRLSVGCYSTGSFQVCPQSRARQTM